MKRIGLLSDTHGYIHPKVIDFFVECDEIWHAGDIGSVYIAEKLKQLGPLKAVYGNIDGQDIRSMFPKIANFMVEGVKIVITHIGGYPGRYEKGIRELLTFEKPDIFIAGHSHILKVIYDDKYSLLHINPGAAGISGFHKSVTAVRFVIDGSDIRNMEILDIPRDRMVT